MNESPVRIPVNIDLAELDALIDTVPNCGRIVDDRGFTIEDVCKLRGIKRSQASLIVGQLIRDGKVRHIGRRSGRNGPRVFELVTPASQ